MSDTPRTDEAQFGTGRVSVDFARTLERELNAANQRIKQLEAVVNDPEVLWSNWLRGTVKLPSGIGDVRQYQARIKRLEEAGDEIVEAGWSVQDWSGMCVVWAKAKEDKP